MTLQSHDHRWIQSASGRKVNLLEPDRRVIVLEDIVHALSQLCRYTGHTARFYSVAEHSVRVSRRAEQIAREKAAAGLPVDIRNVARWGLLHDASEAYLGDVSRPLKYLPGMEAYRQLEKRWALAIAAKFGCADGEPDEVKQADYELLGTEAYHLMQPIHPLWGLTCPGGKLPEPLTYGIGWVGWDSETARDHFLMRFEDLFGWKP